MSVQRDVDDPERIGPVRHPDDCDCERCDPPKCRCCDAVLEEVGATRIDPEDGDLCFDCASEDP